MNSIKDTSSWDDPKCRCNGVNISIWCFMASIFLRIGPLYFPVDVTFLPEIFVPAQSFSAFFPFLIPGNQWPRQPRNKGLVEWGSKMNFVWTTIVEATLNVALVAIQSCSPWFPAIAPLKCGVVIVSCVLILSADFRASLFLLLQLKIIKELWCFIRAFVITISSWHINVKYWWASH